MFQQGKLNTIEVSILPQINLTNNVNAILKRTLWLTPQQLFHLSQKESPDFFFFFFLNTNRNSISSDEGLTQPGVSHEVWP